MVEKFTHMFLMGGPRWVNRVEYSTCMFLMEGPRWVSEKSECVKHLIGGGRFTSTLSYFWLMLGSLPQFSQKCDLLFIYSQRRRILFEYH